jgi:AcrR family transcriptional regulator
LGGGSAAAPEDKCLPSIPENRTAPAKVRVPNVERSARTREKLILTTIQCLYELGYHETSTTVVIERAGVSRGAMLHQFPTKSDLMMATTEYIRGLRGMAHRDGLEGVDDPRERLTKLVDILWSELKSPSGVARIEIMLGSRSDPDFSERFAKVNKALEEAHKEGFWLLAQRLGFKDRKVSDALVQLYAASLRGLAIDALQKDAADLDAAVALLKRYHLLLVEDLLRE